MARALWEYWKQEQLMIRERAEASESGDLELICSSCNGSGEGQYEGGVCHNCKGKGVVYVED